MTKTNLILLTLLILFAEGCGPIIAPLSDDMSYYVITDDGTMPQSELGSYSLTLLVRDTKANAFVNSRKIIFSETARTRGYYQFAQWVEPPPGAFTELLLERLNESKMFTSVTRIANSAIGDMQLNTELAEFYHDISKRPGYARVKVRVELVDLHSRAVISQRDFEKNTEVSSYDAEGAVQGLTQAVNEIVNEIVAWMDPLCRKVDPALLGME